MTESSEKNVKVETDISALEKQINLTARPVAAKWTAETLDNSKGAVPGPTDYRLTALLEYDEKSAAELARRLDSRTSEKSLGNADVQSWFSEPVKREAKTVDGRTYLEGARYSADEFLRSPYQNGTLVRVGKTNFFVLNLFSF